MDIETINRKKALWKIIYAGITSFGKVGFSLILLLAMCFYVVKNRYAADIVKYDLGIYCLPESTYIMNGI